MEMKPLEAKQEKIEEPFYRLFCARLQIMSHSLVFFKELSHLNGVNCETSLFFEGIRVCFLASPSVLICPCHAYEYNSRQSGKNLTEIGVFFNTSFHHF